MLISKLLVSSLQSSEEFVTYAVSSWKLQVKSESSILRRSQGPNANRRSYHFGWKCYWVRHSGHHRQGTSNLFVGTKWHKHVTAISEWHSYSKWHSSTDIREQNNHYTSNQSATFIMSDTTWSLYFSPSQSAISIAMLSLNLHYDIHKYILVISYQTLYSPF